jgi:PAS domain S-box-containing protein
MTVAGMANWELNLETFIFTYSDRLYQMLGTTAEEEGGYQMSAEKYVGKYIHPDDASLIMRAIQEGLQAPDPQNFKGSLEYRMIRKDGELRYMLTDYRLIVNEQGKPVAGVGSFLDITERKLAELTIARRAEELKTVATVSTTASTVLDPDKLLQSVVDLTKERFGLYHTHIYTYDESWSTLLLAAGAGEVGRKLVAEEHAIPLALEQSLVARAARDRKPVIVNDVASEPGFLPNPLLPETRAEMAVPMTVGDILLGVFDVQSNNAAGFSNEDAAIYVTLAAQVGVALQNARSYVEQAALVTQLRELDRLKSSFLANMSHELRTPLNSILGFADVIIEELDGPLTENMTNDLRLIQKNGQHLLHLINDVLDMAKIEAGRMNLNPEKFTAFEVLEEVTSITSTLASEKNLALFIEPDSDQDVQIYADRTRLRQVMINLVNNAIKFTENGKISLKLAALEGARVLFTIKDTGIGIPPDKLEAIFQEFTQVDSSTTRKVGGTGLGLPISRRLVEMHGGRLWAESAGVTGAGSTFFVELPVEARLTETIEKQAK